MPLIPKAMVKAGYRPQAEDTCIDADVFQFSLLRQLSLPQKAERVMQLDCSIRKISLVKTDMILDPIGLTRDIDQLLEPLGIAYYVGGSLASSLWGEPRYSEDLDLIIAIAPQQSKQLIKSLEANYYISEVAVEDALAGRCTSFNIIHLSSTEKVDLFVSTTTPFAVAKMERRIHYLLPTGDKIWVCSPEDIILQKLVWGRGSHSEKQWRDVLGVMKVQGTGLDFDYLWFWADELSITEALVQALEQTGL
jgi:hypothetical protein